jgi:hypothetical protein
MKNAARYGFCMEKSVRIRTPDKKFIYGTLNGTSRQNLVVFVHGLTGHQNEHIFYNAARFFPKKGFSTFRFDLYSFPKDARKLHETTIAQHAADVATVVRHFRKYKNIFLVGHSLGGPSILLSTLSGVKGVVLWDPSLGRTGLWGKYVKAIDKYVLDWNVSYLMSMKMYDEWGSLPDQVKIVNDLSIPVRIIFAEKGELRKRWKKVKDCVIIKNATHTFDEEGAEEELFTHTLSFVKKYS